MLKFNEEEKSMIVKTEKELIKPYTFDSANMPGEAEILYFPEKTSEIAEIIQNCYEKGIPFTLSGAGTGLTGGKTPMGGAIISTEKLNKIIRFDDEKATVTIQPGVIFTDLDKELSDKGYFYPPNPTETNSTLGGNVATNASGARTFKYGSTRDYVVRLLMVLPDGDKLNIKRGEVFEKNGMIELVTESGNEIKLKISDIKMPDIKHAAGYYLKPGMDAIDLFIGSEGTLGVFAEIELKLLPRIENILGGLIFFDDEKKMLEFINKTRKYSIKNNDLPIDKCRDISARLIELFDDNSLEILKEHFNEIPDNSAGAVWIEQEFKPEHEEELLEKWYAHIDEHTNYTDLTWFALDDKQHEKLMAFRHQLPLEVYETLTSNAYRKIGTDTAVPNEHFNDLYYLIKDNLKESGLQNVVFGHTGNSHLHANIFVHSDYEFERAIKIYDNVIENSLQMNGTVSAEHGIGKLKKKYLLKMFGKDNIQMMKKLKLQLDNKNLMGKGTLFD